jgi:hypothetical protein
MAGQSTPRRFQFSLRTLLVVVTLLAILSGWGTWTIKDQQRLNREREQTIQRLRDYASSGKNIIWFGAADAPADWPTN